MTLTREQAKEIGKVRKAMGNGQKAEQLEKIFKTSSVEDLTKMIQHLSLKKVEREIPQKVRVINRPEIQKIKGKTESEIKNWPNIWKVAGEVVAKVAFPAVQKITGAVTAKIENFPVIQKIVGVVDSKVTNFPEVQKVKITNPTEKVQIEGVTRVSNLPLGKSDKEGDPERFVNVRLTDGKRNYDLKELIMAGGGFLSAKVRNFIDGSGKESQALVDIDHHLQVDVLSGGGGGTLKTDAQAIAGTDTAGIVAGKDGSDDAQFLATDTSGHLQVDVLSGGGAGTQYDEGDTDASITGTAVMWEDASDTLRAVSSSKPLPVAEQGTVTVTATNLDVRDLTSASDSVEVVQGTAADLKATVTQAGTVTVDATNLDIRDLTNASDSVLIYGSDDGGSTKRVIKTDAGGAIQVDLEVASVTISDVNMATSQTDDLKVTLDNELVTISGISPGVGGSNLGKMEGQPHTDGDVGVMTLGVRQDNIIALSSPEGDYTPLVVNEHGVLRTQAQQHLHLDEMGATTDWSVLGDDTVNLATTTNHVVGTLALEFDKTNGSDNTVFAGIQKTLSGLPNFCAYMKGNGFFLWSIYLSSIADVAYVFLRVGTDSSNYNEWRIDDDDLAAGWNSLRMGVFSPNAIVGSGWNSASVTYAAVGVAFDAQDDALADIAVDHLSINTGLQTSADITSEVSTSVNSPNVRLVDYGGSVNTDIGVAGSGVVRVAQSSDQFGEVQATPTANTLLSRVKAIADNQLADGHAVTIDNISTNEVYVRGSGTAGSADVAVLTVQGIASGVALAVTESSPISGFATSAKQLAAGHTVDCNSSDVTIDNAAGSGVYIRPGTSASFDVNLQSGAGTDLTATTVGADHALDINLVQSVALAVTESSPISGFATSAKQLAAGHEVSIGAATGAAGDLAKIEDATHASGDVGVMALAVENEDQADLSTGDKDYTPIAVTKEGNVIVKQEGAIVLAAGTALVGDVSLMGNTVVDGSGSDLHTLIDAAGHLQVDVITAPSTAVTNAGTFAVQISDTSYAVADGNALGEGVLVQGDDGTDRKNIHVDATTGDVQVDVTNTVTVDLAGNNDVTVTSGAIDVLGDVAHDAADSGDPVKIGGKAQSHLAAPAEVTAANDRVNALFDRVGRQAVYQGYVIKSAVINCSTSGNNTIVAAVATKRIRVLAVAIVSDGTTDVRWESGAGGAALTGQIPLQAREGYTISNPWGLFETAAVNTLMNLELTAAVSVHGWITYLEVDD